jgi:hypothetical protein
MLQAQLLMGPDAYESHGMDPTAGKSPQCCSPAGCPHMPLNTGVGAVTRLTPCMSSVTITGSWCGRS